MDYITRAQDMQLNLSNVNESISEEIFVSFLLMRLPHEFQYFCILAKFGKDKFFDENKPDLISFESEKRNERNTEKPVFFVKDWTCFNCHKREHIANHWNAQQSEPNNGKFNWKITCFMPKTVGHIVENNFTNTKFEYHAVKN